MKRHCTMSIPNVISLFHPSIPSVPTTTPTSKLSDGGTLVKYSHIGILTAAVKMEQTKPLRALSHLLAFL